MIQILACFLGFSSNREWAFPRSSSFKAFRLCSLLRKNTKFFLHDINRNRTQFDSKSKQREEPACAVPIEYFSEEVMELAEREEQAVAEVGRQLGQIQNCYHFHSKLCDNGFESEKRKI